MRWQGKSKSFHPRGEMPLNPPSDIGILQHKCAVLSTAPLFIAVVLLATQNTKPLFGLPVLLNSDQTIPQFGELSWKFLAGSKVNFPACLNGSWKQDISIDVHLLSYALPENLWLLQEVFIYRKLDLYHCHPSSIKLNGCNSLLDSRTFPCGPGGLVSEQRERAAGNKGLEALSSSQICVFNI